MDCNRFYGKNNNPIDQFSGNQSTQKKTLQEGLRVDNMSLSLFLYLQYIAAASTPML